MTHERVIDTPYVHGEPFPNGVYRVHYYDNGRWTDRMLHINGNSIMWSRQIDDWGAVTDSGIPWDRQTLLIAALTGQPFAAWPSYRWTKLGDPLSAYGYDNAIAIHTGNFRAEDSNFKVWIELVTPNLLPSIAVCPHMRRGPLPVAIYYRVVVGMEIPR